MLKYRCYVAQAIKNIALFAVPDECWWFHKPKKSLYQYTHFKILLINLK